MFKNLRSLVITGAVALPLTFTALPAHAGTTTSTFGVSATVVNTCVVNSAGALAFGSYNPLNATNTTGSSVISVNCTKGDAYTIALNDGLYGTSDTTRAMSDGATPTPDKLAYQIYTNNTYTTVWNSSCTAGNNCASGTGAGPGVGNAQTYTVYGSITAGQNVPANSYSDTITLTVTF